MSKIEVNLECETFSNPQVTAQIADWKSRRDSLFGHEDLLSLQRRDSGILLVYRDGGCPAAVVGK
jgi:hypothetical protein